MSHEVLDGYDIVIQKQIVYEIVYVEGTHNWYIYIDGEPFRALKTWEVEKVVAKDVERYSIKLPKRENG